MCELSSANVYASDPHGCCPQHEMRVRKSWKCNFKELLLWKSLLCNAISCTGWLSTMNCNDGGLAGSAL